MSYLLLAADEPNGVHLPADILEVYWGTAAFLVVMFLLVRFAGPPLMRMFRSRTERIEQELADAAAARDEAEAALTASSADLPDVSVEEARIREDAVETAAKLKADLIAKAQSDADDIRTRGTAEVENYRRQAIADLTAEMSRLTKESAEAVVVENLDDSTHADLIDSYIDQVQQLS
ncbi:MAG: F0F1 ATP synthase subunit B [Actinomycetota bacterium]